jgi:hypothetical protein
VDGARFAGVVVMGSHLPPSRLLSDHHDEIAIACRAIRSYRDDRQGLITAYRYFESVILAHFGAEEELLLPAYAKHDPASARLIREEHDLLRSRMTQTAIDVELEGVSAAQIDELVELLRAHAAFEDTTLYRWADLPEADGAIAALARIERPKWSLGAIPAGVEHTGYSR